MTIEEVKTYRVTCDWYDTEGGKCPSPIAPKIKAICIADVHDELCRRGWAVVPTENHFHPLHKHYCPSHQSEGKPYPPMAPAYRDPYGSIRELKEPFVYTTGSEFHDAVNEERL